MLHVAFLFPYRAPGEIVRIMHDKIRLGTYPDLAAKFNYEDVGEREYQKSRMFEGTVKYRLRFGDLTVETYGNYYNVRGKALPNDSESQLVSTVATMPDYFLQNYVDVRRSTNWVKAVAAQTGTELTAALFTSRHLGFQYPQVVITVPLGGEGAVELIHHNRFYAADSLYGALWKGISLIGGDR